MSVNSEQSIQSTATSASASATINPGTSKTTEKRKRGVEDLTSALTPLYAELAKSRAKIEKAKGPNEIFAMEVASVLNNVHDQTLIKHAKARIQLILGELMTETAKRVLAESEPFSPTPSHVSDSNSYWNDTSAPMSPAQATARHYLPHHEVNTENSQHSQSVLSPPAQTTGQHYLPHHELNTENVQQSQSVRPPSSSLFLSRNDLDALDGPQNSFSQYLNM